MPKALVLCNTDKKRHPSKHSDMADQQFSNHTRYHPLYHFIASPLILAGLIWTVIRYFNSSSEEGTPALIDAVAFLCLFLLGVLVRTYALKVQDRAIRAEESLRFFILTGKPLDSRLRLGQIVALRFASDEELPELANLAVEKSMSAKDIKGAIRQWRADDRRV
jgi:hypothetical protein